LLGSLAELLKGHFGRMRAEASYQRLLKTEAERQWALSDHRAKDQYLSTISHELRSSLHVTLSWVHALKQGSQDPSMTARGLELLERNITLQAKLVDDLIDLSRAKG